MTDEIEINGQVRTALQFAALDPDDFDAQEFARHWPTQLQDQQLALAMLVVSNGRSLKKFQELHRREMAAVRRSVSRLWLFVPFLLAGVVVAVAHTLGLEDPAQLLTSGLLAGAVGEALKRMLGSSG